MVKKLDPDCVTVMDDSFEYKPAHEGIRDGDVDIEGFDIDGDTWTGAEVGYAGPIGEGTDMRGED